MRIGIDGRLWNETGVGRYIRNLVYNLSEVDKKNDYVLFLRKGIRNNELGIRETWKIVEADIRWHTLEEQIKFPKILEKENLDLVHFPYFSIPINYKKPYIITIHDLILNHFSTGKASTLPPPLYFAKRQGYKFVISRAIKNAKKIIAPLNAVKEDILKTYNIPENKIEVTYEGVDNKISNFKFPISNFQFKNEKYFLYVGNAYPHKNLDKLIEGFEILQSTPTFAKASAGEQDDIKLVLVGKDDHFYRKLYEKIESEKIEGVIVKNDVSDEELVSLYKNAIAFVSASLMEGFGLPVLEAMSNKCLVVVSDITSFNEVAGASAVYFNPNSSIDIAEKLTQVLKMTKSEKEKLISEGFNRSKQFSWEKMSRETLKIYESCIGL